MGEHSAVTTAADPRRRRPALRPLLIIGGFMFLWWCLATGTAHADSTTERGSSLVDHALPAAANAVPQKPEALPKPVERPVAAVRAVVEPVVEPVAQEVVEPVVERTRAIMDTTPAGPAVESVLSKVESLSETLPVVEESSTGQGETRISRASQSDARARSRVMPPADAGTPEGMRLVAFSVSEDRLSPTQPTAGSPDGDPFQHPAPPQSSSVQAGSSPQVTPGVPTTPLELQESAGAAARSGPNERLHAGPAYPPVSSPD